eukprot:122784-Amphidinium_carterae.1
MPAHGSSSEGFPGRPDLCSKDAEGEGEPQSLAKLRQRRVGGSTEKKLQVAAWQNTCVEPRCFA